MRATVITDASYCHKSKAGGWAAWVSPDQGQRVQVAGAFRDRPGCNNTAEVQAAINGIFVAYKLGARDILIQSDSVAVATAMKKGKWGWHTAKAKHFPDAKIRYRHVKGHTRDKASRSWVNRWCDREAKRYMREQRDGIAIQNF